MCHKITQFLDSVGFHEKEGKPAERQVGNRQGSGWETQSLLPNGLTQGNPEALGGHWFPLESEGENNKNYLGLCCWEAGTFRQDKYREEGQEKYKLGCYIIAYVYPACKVRCQEHKKLATFYAESMETQLKI